MTSNVNKFDKLWWCSVISSSLVFTLLIVCLQAVDTVEDIDTLQATLSPVDGLCLPELTSTSVAELLLNDLPAAESTCPLSESLQQGFSVPAKHAMTTSLTDDILIPHYSSLPLAVDGDGLLSNAAALGFQDDLQSLFHATKLSSDVMLTDDSHSLLLPAAELDAFDTLQLAGTHQPTSACEIDADDFLFDDADWSSVQVIIISTCSLQCLK